MSIYVDGYKALKSILDTMIGVLGTSSDTHGSNTVNGRTKLLKDHIHGAAKVYPTLAAGVQLTCGSTNYGEGAYYEIVPANTIASEFDIHWLNIENMSDNDVYEIAIGVGTSGNETEIGRIRATRTANQVKQDSIMFMTELQSANVRVAGKMACSGTAQTATVSIGYHVY